MDERRNIRKKNLLIETKDMMDALMDAEDDNGRKLSDEEIIDILVMYLNAGHESSGHITMWTTVLLQKHPEYFQKAKVILHLMIYFSSHMLKDDKHMYIYCIC